MIVDANILLYSIDESSPHHPLAAAWLTGALNSEQRVGLPWQTLGAFLRIATHPKVSRNPLGPAEAQGWVDAWLNAESTWIPPATERTAVIYRDLARRHFVTGNVVPDAQLAALAIENGVALVSADTDFARFTEVHWINPTAHT